MNKDITKQLLQLVKDNPDLPIVPLVDYEVCCGDDFAYWLGSFVSCKCGNYALYNERVWLDDEEEELKEAYFYENACEERYDKNIYTQDEIEHRLVEDTKNLWHKAIIVFIGLPDEVE